MSAFGGRRQAGSQADPTAASPTRPSPDFPVASAGAHPDRQQIRLARVGSRAIMKMTPPAAMRVARGATPIPMTRLLSPAWLPSPSCHRRSGPGFAFLALVVGCAIVAAQTPAPAPAQPSEEQAV